MSKIKVNSLQGLGANTAAIVIDNTTGGCSANLTNNLSNRNILINGAMQVAQRGTSVSSLSSSNKVQVVDRMFCRMAGSAGTWTISQSTDAPEGFANSLKWDCTTANASPHATNDFAYIQQRIEGFNVQHLKKGTANALKTTLSFYVKSNKTGNFAVRLNDADNSRHVGATYAINSANTWERKTVTFPGDTTGTLDNDNAQSLNVLWWMVIGSGRTSGSVPTSWSSLVTAEEAAGQNVNMADSTSNEFYITGIQLEVGEIASDFEMLPISRQLEDCQRYYYKDPSGGKDHGTWVTYTPNGDSRGRQSHPKEMRATPTMTFSSTTWRCVGTSNSHALVNINFTGVNAANSSRKTWSINTNSLSGYGQVVSWGSNSSITIQGEAEL